MKVVAKAAKALFIHPAVFFGLLFIGILMKATPVLLAAGGVLLLYCLARHPKVTLGCIALGLIGTALKRVPDVVVVSVLVFVFLAWAIVKIRGAATKIEPVPTLHSPELDRPKDS